MHNSWQHQGNVPGVDVLAFSRSLLVRCSFLGSGQINQALHTFQGKRQNHTHEGQNLLTKVDVWTLLPPFA